MVVGGAESGELLCNDDDDDGDTCKDAGLIFSRSMIKKKRTSNRIFNVE